MIGNPGGTNQSQDDSKYECPKFTLIILNKHALMHESRKGSKAFARF